MQVVQYDPAAYLHDLNAEHVRCLSSHNAPVLTLMDEALHTARA